MQEETTKQTENSFENNLKTGILSIGLKEPSNIGTTTPCQKAQEIQNSSKIEVQDVSQNKEMSDYNIAVIQGTAQVVYVTY